MVSPKRSSYSKEENIYDAGNIMMYLIHFTGLILMDLKNTFGIKDATTKHIPGADIHNYPGMENSSFNNAHQRSMN